MLNNQKKCSKCGEIKELSEFHKQSSVKSGHRSSCKVCRSHPLPAPDPNIKQKLCNFCNTVRDISLFNKDNRRYGRFRTKCKICESEYRKDNDENIKNKKGLHYILTKEDHNKRGKEYYIQNKEHIKTKTKEYRKTDFGKMVQKNAQHKRRVTKRRVSDGTIPQLIPNPLTKELQQLLEKQNYKCYLCNCDISSKRHLDHWIPISKGGTHSINNVIFLCPTCNLRKSETPPKGLLLI